MSHEDGQGVATATPLPQDTLVVAPTLSGASASIANLVAALAAAQATIKQPTKDRTAEVRSEKGNYSYNYADLATVLDVVRPALAAQGLAVIQLPSVEGEGVALVRTVLAHKSGEWIENRLRTRLLDAKPQTLGSAITYLRRYALQAIVGVAAEEDDDASTAQGVDATTAPRPKAERPAESKPAGGNGSGERVRHDRPITEPQTKRLFAIMRGRAEKLGVDAGDFREVVKQHLKTAYGIETAGDIKETVYDEIVQWVQAFTPGEAYEPPA